ncbi:hypothetical protein AB0A85_27165, partial [Kitasatospora aureofaciens]
MSPAGWEVGRADFPLGGHSLLATRLVSRALALGLYDDVVVRVADSGLAVDIAGEGAGTLP